MLCKQGASCTLIYYNSYIQSYTCTQTSLFSPHPQNKDTLSHNTQLPQSPLFHSNRHTAHTLQVSFTSLCIHCYAYCQQMDSYCTSFYPLFLSAFVVSRTMSSFNPLCFALLTTPFIPIYGLSLIVKVCALAACLPPGSVCLYWISSYVQDKMAYHPYT